MNPQDQLRTVVRASTATYGNQQPLKPNNHQHEEVTDSSDSGRGIEECNSVLGHADQPIYKELTLLTGK